MLTPQEKEKLYTIIVMALGEDPSIERRKNMFNEVTVDKVKIMIKELKECNDAMKSLTIHLQRLGYLATRRWIRVAFTFLKQYTKKQEFKGAACKNFTKSKWRSTIYTSTI
jgi:hypothetical protein